ncbi:hypothetical protein FNV43_RR22802 [Rhamnella rubrinervis]|uniref:AB hydrolase-1 domain-containing protein n=1 Tax=Rhamnella rubrinervis TaxID=2594499 RepID=A0A8K0DR43_9ROSA|nr:hypothetical protein FNV43_RR22802 [Rhamnella rubrinervis]
MANLFEVLNPILRAFMKLYGLRAQQVEIDPGTVINFWAPISTVKNYKNKANPAMNNIELKHKKPALVLIHGFAGTGVLTWWLQVAALSGKYEIYVPDVLFFGGSITDSPKRSPEFQAECLAKGLKLLGVGRCTVVGCSYGGIVGSKMAVSDPNLVECLVLSNSNVGVPESHSKAALKRIGVGSWVDHFLPSTVEDLKVLLGSVVYRRPWFPNWAYKHFLKAMFDNREERAELLEAMIIKDNEYVIPNFSQKIYIVAGEEDKIFNQEIVHQTKKCQLSQKSTHAVYIPNLIFFGGFTIDHRAERSVEFQAQFVAKGLIMQAGY